MTAAAGAEENNSEAVQGRVGGGRGEAPCEPSARYAQKGGEAQREFHLLKKQSKLAIISDIPKYKLGRFVVPRASLSPARHRLCHAPVSIINEIDTSLTPHPVLFHTPTR